MIKHITIFARPWDSAVFLRMARELQQELSTPDIKIRILTLWRAAYDAVKKDLKEGEEVIFLPALLKQCVITDEDKQRLIKIEGEMFEECGTPLRTMLDAERFKPKTSANAEAFMWRHFAVLEKLIPPQSILLSIQPDHFCYWLACDLIRYRRGLFFGFALVGRPSEYTQVLKNARQLWMPNEVLTEHMTEATEQRNQIASGLLPGYMHKQTDRVQLYQALLHKVYLVREIYLGNYFVNIGNIEPRICILAQKIKWWFQRQRIKFIKYEQIRNEKYVYLALHMEPEASTWVYSPLFRDQAFWIDCVAKSLPLGIKLVVKENPKMWGKRSYEFYRKINSYAQACIVEPTASSADLVQHAEAVLTITGTVAVEAALMGKPVALFGPTPFADALSSIPKVDSLEELPIFLHQLIEGKLHPEKAFVDLEFTRYVSSLIPKTFKASEKTGNWKIPWIDPYEREYVDFILKAVVAEGVANE